LRRAHALLHQATRARTRSGTIVATIADYAAGRELVGDLVAEGIGRTVAPRVRETVEAVRDSNPGDDGVSQRALADKLSLDKGAVSRRVQEAVGHGYLRNLEERRGRPARLVIGEPRPEQLEILPAPGALAECCAVDGVSVGIGNPLPNSLGRASPAH
jgi:hypothetical protein